MTLPDSAGQDLRESSSWQSRRLWSLWDMLESSAYQYLSLGARVWRCRMVFDLGRFDDAEKATLRDTLQEIIKICEQLGLSVSLELLRTRVEKLPQSADEIDLLMQA